VRTIGASLDAHLAGNAHTLAACLRLDLANGDTLAFTDHDLPLVVDLGDGTTTYEPWTGISASDVVLTTGWEASNFEVTGPIGEVVTRTAVSGGRFRRATARLFMVNWDDLTMGYIPLMRGRVASARVEGSRFVFEVRNALDILNQSQGRVMSPYCSAIFGDAQCGVVRTAYPCEVTAVTDSFRFTVDLGGSHADDFFNFGSVDWLTGELTGTEEGKVFDYNGTTGALELYEPLIEASQVGDTLNLYRGCSKLLKSDDATLPTCLSYENVINFRGWPECPSSRFYHKVSAPGTSYA
jgi:uncharacterized phage protein (TIGR02218 family)